MFWRIVRAVMRKEIVQIFRDGQTWILVMFTPAMLLVMFAYLFSLDTDRFSLALLDLDNTPSSREYVAALTADGVVRVERVLLHRSEIEPQLVRASMDGVLVIPAGFERELRAGRPALVQVILDGSDPVTASPALAEISLRTAHYSRRVTLRAVEAGAFAEGLLDVRDVVWYNPTLKSLISMVPGLLAVVMFMPAFSAAQALAREKELGTLESLLATPIGRAELVIGKGLPYLLTGLVGMIVSAAVAMFWFRVPFRGHFGLFLLLGFDFLFATIFLGLLIANFVESQQAAMIAMFILFFLPSFFLSGLIDPLESARLAARIEGALLPTSYFVTISRGIFLKGVGLTHLWKPALNLAGLGVASLALAVLTFKNRLA